MNVWMQLIYEYFRNKFLEQYRCVGGQSDEQDEKFHKNMTEIEEVLTLETSKLFI